MFRSSKPSGHLTSSGIQYIRDPKKDIEVFVKDNVQNPIQIARPILPEKKRKSKYQRDD
jgi:hypothetical protein